MRAVLTAARELTGLFVEDRLFALAIAGWLAACALAASTKFGSPEVRAYTLFAGLAAILIASVLRGAAPK